MTISLAMPVFTPPGDFRLQTNSAKVPIDEICSQEIQDTVDRMFKIAEGERNDTGENCVMVGLAAPQIGVFIRIILVDLGVRATGVNSDGKRLGNLKELINPEITWISEESTEGTEACYSVDGRLSGVVRRAEKIRIQAFDRQGNLISEEFSGFTATIVQHEMDHLDGIRFPDRFGPQGQLHWVNENLEVGLISRRSGAKSVQILVCSP